MHCLIAVRYVLCPDNCPTPYLVEYMQGQHFKSTHGQAPHHLNGVWQELWKDCHGVGDVHHLHDSHQAMGADTCKQAFTVDACKAQAFAKDSGDSQRCQAGKTVQAL